MVWTVVLFYMLIFALLRIPAVQEFLADNVSVALSDKLGTEVRVGRIDIRLFNRLVTDDVLVKDQNGEQMLRASRISAGIELLPLVHGEIKITSAQIFGTRIKLYRRDSLTPVNCQFLIDSLASKDTTSSSPLNLSIASLIIRNSSLSYDEYDKPYRKGQFSPYHVDISKLSSHILLYKLTDEDLDVQFKRLSFSEASGIKVNSLVGQLVLSKGNVNVKNFKLELPNTTVSVPSFITKYQKQDDRIIPGSLIFDGTLNAEKFTPSDVAPLLLYATNGSKDLLEALPVMNCKLSVKGTDKVSNANVSIESPDGNVFDVKTNLQAWNIIDSPSVEAKIDDISLSERLIKSLQKTFDLPDMVSRLGDVNLKGNVKYFGKNHQIADVKMKSSRVGEIIANGEYDSHHSKAMVKTSDFNMAQLLDDDKLGKLNCDIALSANTADDGRIISAKAKGTVNEISYNGYTYHAINIDGAFANETVTGELKVTDPNIVLNASGSMTLGHRKGVDATINIHDFAPKALNLTSSFGNDIFDFDVNANFTGASLDDAIGDLSINDITITNPDSLIETTYLRRIKISSYRSEDGVKQISLNTDFANIAMRGNIVLSDLPYSLNNIIAQQLNTVPGLMGIKKNSNDFTIDANIDNLTFINRLFHTPVEIDKPVRLNGFVNSIDNTANIDMDVPHLLAKGVELSDTHMRIWTPDNEVRTTLNTSLHDSNGKVLLGLDCKASDNILQSALSWDNKRGNTFKGSVNTSTRFYKSLNGNNALEINIPLSTFEVGDSIWHISSEGINYEDNRLIVKNFQIGDNGEYVHVDGIASEEQTDSIVATLCNVNVKYILDLVNFTSVEFAGSATGTAVGHAVLGDVVANAHLDVKDFMFEKGYLGMLYADASYSNETGSIQIDALTDDPAVDGKIFINGYVSPKHNDIDLALLPRNARLDFLNTYCGSFMDDIDLSGSGDLRLYGPLDAINLVGNAVAKGAFTIAATNCRYYFDNDTVSLTLNDIRFNNQVMRDALGNRAYINGGIHHRNLAEMSYDISLNTNRLLAYDAPTLDGDTYCGYAIISGDVNVNGRGNELVIAVDATTLPDTYFVYDASSPDAITSQDFITWGSINDKEEVQVDEYIPTRRHVLVDTNDRTNIRLNLTINTTTDAKLHLIMDSSTGDNIDLYGTGTLRVNYYNKGGLDIYGNYLVDHGSYRMTIQSLLRRDFAFQKGGTIAFGGEPLSAVLNLKAAYMLNSVSLADLSIGSSFKSNNVPVNCLMNITGTPEHPRVSFGLDLPSLSSDARQMVYSVINTEEEMNQQVLYLLGIGRFYSQNNASDNAERTTSQSSLAVQSFFSGTLTQQFNNIINQVIGKNNWSLGANITPGADGFNNAEYEGTLSGTLFKNRLRFNGQFGYRDNVMRNSQSFIGDFSLQYLLTPNGNFSLKMYNQANDRYFTRNSLNTQGIGVVIQKEFGK